MSEYTEQGYKSRTDYLDTLAMDYEIPRETVEMLAALLGPSEDFDGLVIACEDVAEELERDEFWSLTIDKENLS